MTRIAIQREFAKMSQAQKLKLIQELWNSIAADQKSAAASAMIGNAL